MNAPRDPWDQGGYGQQPGQPGPRYYPPPAGQQPGIGQPPPGWAGPGQQAPGWAGPGQPGGGQPPAGYGGPAYGEQPGYAYNPYGTPYPGVGEPEPSAPSRPGLLVLVLIMQILVSLPFLFLGVAVLLVPLNTASLPPEILNNPQIAQAGATSELLLSLIRTIGVIILVVALIYLLFAVLAFTGRNWSRIITAVLSVGFVLLLLAGVVNTGGGADNLLVLGIPVLLLVGSVVMSFLPAANAWYTHRR